MHKLINNINILSYGPRLGQDQGSGAKKAFFMLFPMTLILTLTFLSACSGLQTESTYSDPVKEKMYKHGSLASDKGGIDLLGGEEKAADTGGLGVNGYLWRAALDTVSFMPIISADPFGGVILTDWYTAPNTPDERIKLNITILDRELRADGVRVGVFRQAKDGGEWTDMPVGPSTGNQLENVILTRARQMRLAQKERQG